MLARPFVALAPLAVTTCLAAVDASTSPSAWLGALDAAVPATDGRTVEGLRLAFGSARIDIERGVLVAVKGPSARPQELLFIGKARFALATDDPVETYQIELFTGRERLDEPVTR